MARMRVIKPEFWTSEQIVSCSRDARLLFIGLLNFCDDAGLHPLSYQRLKMEVFPAEHFTIDEIQALVGELINAGLINVYYVEGKGYLIVTGWHHQRIDTPTYRYPLLEKHMNPKVKYSKDIHQQLVDDSTSPPGVILDQSQIYPRSIPDVSQINPSGLDPVKESTVKESKKNICKLPSEVLPVSCEVNELFDYWKLKMNQPRAKLDANRKKTIKAALCLGYSIEHLKEAIDGCSNTPYNMGKNEQKKKYNGIGLIFRDAEHIERFIQNNQTNTDIDSLNYRVSQIDQAGEGAI